MDISYRPNGTARYTCEAKGDNELRVVVCRSSEGSDTEATREDLPTAALVDAVEQLAENEFGRRRARTDLKREHHEKQSAQWRNAAGHISELLGAISDKKESGWCSGCLARAEHRLVAERTKYGTRQYLCCNCGTPTGWCRCPSMQALRQSQPHAA